jgi:hypothetical protein
VVEREAEVEGPRARADYQVVGQLGEEGRIGLLGRQVAVGSPDGDAQLDGLEEIDVAPESLVVIRRFVFKVANGPRDDARELGVLVR